MALASQSRPVRAGAAPRRTRLAAWVCLLAILVASSTAAADKVKGSQRAVAVLQYRAGSPALAGIDRRLVDILRKKTSLAVVDSDEARKRYGNDLDAAVAACGGESRCIARIGRALEVEDVLLIGISQFGDIILTLQRIDTRRSRVRARIAEALPPEVTPDAEMLSGYLQRVMPRTDFLRFGIIRVDADVAGATVSLDGKEQGVTPLAPLQVQAPATYDIRIAKSGFMSFEASVFVPPDAQVVVQPRLPHQAGGAWYRRWWVAAVAGSVAVASVALFVALDDDAVPVTIRF